MSLFVIKRPDALGALPRWLRQRSANHYTTGNVDHNGNALICLFDRGPGDIWEPRGVIMSIDDKLIPTAEKIIRKTYRMK